MKKYKAGILFVHGIKGRPRRFNFIIHSLPETIACRSILLPGHGMNMREFRKSDKEQWLKAVHREAEKMLEYCENVYFVGHSMGCLLGLITQVQTEISFSGMLLLCCPFHVKVSMRHIATTHRVHGERNGSADPFSRSPWLPGGVRPSRMLEYAVCAHPYMELFELIRTVRSLDSRPNCRVICFFSELDEVVSDASIGFAKRKFGFETRLMQGCSHKFFTDAAQKEIKSALLELMGSESVE